MMERREEGKILTPIRYGLYEAVLKLGVHVHCCFLGSCSSLGLSFFTVLLVILSAGFERLCDAMQQAVMISVTRQW
jgi:hypothetical protein